MALYGQEGDIGLFRAINKELLGAIISQQAAIYKIILGETSVNMYGESPSETYAPPVLFDVLVERGDQEWGEKAYTVDVNRTNVFNFLRDDLVSAKLLPEVGDVILYLDDYYEISSIVENQLFSGKDPNYAYTEGLEKFGSSISIKCTANLAPADKLGITKER